MLWGISEIVNARACKPLPLCSAPLQILTSRDFFWSSQEWMKSTFVSKNVFWEKAVGYLRNGECLELSNLCHCVQHPCIILLAVIFCGALRMKESHLSKPKICFEKMLCGIFRNRWMLELASLCHCVQYPWKLTNRDIWSSRNTRYPICQQKCVLRKCCGVSQKWSMLELANLCHCVQYPWKLTSRDFSGALKMTESHFVTKNVFWENAVGYLRNGEC